jgi:O-antigen biosynthesis protein
MLRRIAGRAHQTASRLLGGAPILKHALKERLLDVMATPTAQSLAYRRWRAAPRSSADRMRGDGPSAGGPWIAVVFPGIPSSAALAAVHSQTYPNVVVGDDGASEWVALPACADALLWPDALALVAETIDADPSADVVYGDEETPRCDPLFKPGFSPELAESIDLFGGLTVVRRALWDASVTGHERTLRLVERAIAIAHVAAVLVTARPSAPDPAAVQAHLARTGRPGALALATETGAVDVRHPLEGEPLVSIVIPSKNALEILRRCLESIAARSTYTRYEIVLVDTGSTEEEVRAYYSDFGERHPGFRVVEFPEEPFSYARSCNAGAEAARGEILILLNNDTEVVTPDWIERLAGEAARPEVGAVGPLLLFPGGRRIQHAGVGIGFGAVAANMLSGVGVRGRMTRTQSLLAWSRRRTTAVTGACLAVRTEAFRAAGGFDPALRITFNDVDLCCRLDASGLRNVYLPGVRLLHHESVSVNSLVRGRRDWDEVDAALAMMRERWSRLIGDDPMVSPLLVKSDARARPELTLADPQLSGR